MSTFDSRLSTFGLSPFALTPAPTCLVPAMRGWAEALTPVRQELVYPERSRGAPAIRVYPPLAGSSAAHVVPFHLSRPRGRPTTRGAHHDVGWGPTNPAQHITPSSEWPRLARRPCGGAKRAPTNPLRWLARDPTRKGDRDWVLMLRVLCKRPTPRPEPGAVVARFLHENIRVCQLKPVLLSRGK